MNHEGIIKPQINEGWCGPACLAEVIKRKLGKEVSQEEIGKVVECTLENGTSHEKMIAGLKSFDVESFANTTLGLDELQEYLDRGSLVIVNWMSGNDIENDGHYSLLEEVGKEMVVLNDPHHPGSLRVLRRGDFEKAWFDIEENEKVENWCLII